ncbi:ring-1,2-phenylacetyl-CoA epoxidase subunit PaaE [Actinoplanes lutulentus]|uniref:Ring-1,2-phenylacetyl-CoA epoxidase subunit PaaE n=1 Tax=Actinoplanes lutulentus TaxID=1287878 RepID=A0A327Z159_9ACTN|nr:1,2-phenylacetyl-CoA epoxidase subunit PaaE [Actinoplanes lutulentus]MBB2943528.1 ring-1,2-phenylacetyl-CoA epoxidase subunit PaaE [Actinoplanes lutulentus]RAK27394.1 ring-1,2-phenylacetyl-CoA epoxidase subunit PaaE [Actinoplanes lutulentus]
MAGHEFHALRVGAVDRLCADAVAVTFAVPDDVAGLFDFRPGQSLTVRRSGGDDERRTYSICSPAGAAPRIGVREVPGGLISQWIVRDLRPGDLVEVAPPAGSFTPDLAAGGRHVLIAAGSGITPVLSIAASLLREPGAEVVLLYGNRRSETVMFAEELADLKDAFPDRLQIVHVLSREMREVELFSGRLDAGRLRALLPLLVDVPAVDHWWLCGPFGMVTAATETLGESGVEPARIHRELFWVDEAPPEPVRVAPAREGDAGSEVTVVLDGRSSTVGVEDGVALLDGLQRSRPDMPFACKGGVCGTCRARVVDGEVTMRRNFALDAAEVAAGFVLTCQARAVSPKVVIDFDQ